MVAISLITLSGSVISVAALLFPCGKDSGRSSKYMTYIGSIFHDVSPAVCDQIEAVQAIRRALWIQVESNFAFDFLSKS